MKYTFWLFILSLLVSCSNDKDSTAIVIQKYKNNEIPIFFKEKGLYGLKDKTGKIIAEPAYTEVWQFEFGSAIVKRGDKEGAVNLLGEEAVPLRKYYVSQFPIRFKGVPGFILVHDLKDYLPRIFKEAIGIRIIKDKEGLYNLGGKEMLPIEYDDILYRGEGYTVGIKGDSIFDYVDQNGNKVKKVSQQFNMHPFKDGIAVAGENGKFGFVDRDLKKVIAFKYDWVKDFNNGLAPVSKGGLWGYINLQDELVIPFTYDEAKTFEGGAAIIRRGNFFGLIDQRGKPLTEIIYSSIRPEQPFQFILEKNNVYTPVKYDQATGQVVYDK